MATGVPGAGARVTGVTVADGAERTPSPKEVMARTLKLYAVPPVSPVIAAVVGVAATSTVLTTVVPVRIWIRKPVIAAPPSSAGAVKARFTRPSPAATLVAPRVAVSPVGADAATTGTTAFGIVLSENRSCSMLRSVSVPSRAVPRACTTVVAVAPKVMS